MKIQHLLIILIIFLVISSTGCKKKKQEIVIPEGVTKLEEINGFRCQDGRLVTDSSHCITQTSTEPKISLDSSDPKIEVRNQKVKTDKTISNIQSPDDASTVYQGYANIKKLGYKVISSEFLEEKEGVSFYKVRYEHNEKSGGRRNVIVDSLGNIYQEMGLP